MVKRIGLLVLVLSTACYSPKLTSGSLLCSKSGKACPDGFYCTAGRCYKNGETPPTPSPDLGGANGNPDLSAPPDLNSPAKMKGDSCGSGAPCAAGLTCVDRVCCTSACTGSCEACDVTGMIGDCTVVSGPPHGTRSQCNNMGTTCGGTCDGSNHACSYPPSSQICGAACDGKCDGNGACSTAGGSCPSGFACDTGGCKTMCSNDNDCQTNFHCAAPACVRDVESDCLDGLDNNGDGLIDCADPTCTNVTCVPSIPGDEIGVVAASCSDGNYPTPEPYHQTLSSVSCTGCGCSATGTVTSTSSFYTSTGCSSGATSISGLTDTGSGVCVPLTAGTHLGFDSGAQNLASNTCSITQQATAGTPTWSTDTNFCVGRQSSAAAACASNKVCVAKPASAAKICVRIPSAGASCPAGYGTLNGTYFTSFNAATCNGCTCVASAGSLSTYFGSAFFEGYTTSDCSEDFGSQAYLDTGGCSSTYASNDGNTYQLSSFNMASIRFIEVQRLPAGFFSCTSAATVSAQAQPTGGSTVCCQ